MNVGNKNAKALSEIKCIIEKMPKEYQEKIPVQLMDNVVKNMDKNYSWDGKSDILPETKAILTVIIKEYFNDDEINKKIDEYIIFYNKINEDAKIKKYGTDVSYAKNSLYDNADDSEEKSVKENALVKHKEKWYNRIFNLIKKIFIH